MIRLVPVGFGFTKTAEGQPRQEGHCHLPLSSLFCCMPRRKHVLKNRLYF